MTIQEIEQNHGSLIGRTGSWYFQGSSLCAKATITAVDYYLQEITLSVIGQSIPTIQPGPDLFMQSFSWDPIVASTRPIQVGDPLQEGDIVRYINKTQAGFTNGKDYIIGGIYWKGCPSDRLGIVADDVGRPNGWQRNMFELVRTPTAQPLEIIMVGGQVNEVIQRLPAHDCNLNVAHYDSGWSAYDYCRICDKKLNA